MSEKKYIVQMQQKLKNGEKEKMYPITNIEAVQDEDGESLSLPRVKKVTLAIEGWIQNPTSEKYEYDIKDSTITEKHRVDGNMDLTNQEKMSDGYTKSYDGGVKIITTDKPDEEIDMELVITKTTGGDNI